MRGRLNALPDEKAGVANWLCHKRWPEFPISEMVSLMWNFPLNVSSLQRALGEAGIHRRIGLGILLAVSFGSVSLKAQEKSQATINDLFGRFGYITERAQEKNCLVTMLIDRKAFVDAIPTLKSMEILNPDITQTRVNVEPTVIALGFALQMSPTVVKDLYDQDKNPDKCSFKQMIAIQDDFGNDKNEVLFKFDFPRSLYRKVNWDKFLPQNLLKIASNFAFGPAMEEVLHEEALAGD